MIYDFSQLNDKEFEVLVADLLSIYFETRIERFKSGKDRGIDGRFFTNSGKEIILQCKHYLKTGYKGLISKLKNEESEKIRKINPEKYIFVTSLPISRDNKEEIKSVKSELGEVKLELGKINQKLDTKLENHEERISDVEHRVGIA